MPDHFLNERELRWERSETRALHDLLKSMYPRQDDAIEALQALGFAYPEADFEFHPKMDRSWRKIMTDLHRRARLIRLIEIASADERLSRFHAELRVLKGGVEAEPTPDSGSFADLDWRGAPITSDGGFERLLRDGRSLVPTCFLSEGARVAAAVAWIEAKFPNDHSYKGSGFLVGSDLLLTNHHVLHDATAGQVAAGEVEARFGYEESGDGLMPPWRTVAGLVDTIRGDATHDWAVIRLAEAPGNEYRWIPLAQDSLIAVDEPVYIIQHPGGRRKMVSIDPAGVVRFLDDDRIQYLTETEEGSSGAPVCNRSWQVVALHHRWEDVSHGDGQEKRNQGIPIARVIEGLTAAGIAIGGNAADAAPGLPPSAVSLESIARRKAAVEPSTELPSAREPIGHGHETEQLRRCLAENIEAGRGGFVALYGGRGYGKFALARSVLETLADDGATVLATSFGSPPTVGESTASVALRERWPQASDRAGWAWLDLVMQAEAAIAQKGRTPPSEHDTDGAAHLRALLRALAADGPVLLLLDELSRAEGPSSEWWPRCLLDLGEQMRNGLPCNVIMTLPPLPFDWGTWIGEMLEQVDDLLQLRVDLDQISGEDAERYLAQRLDGAVEGMVAENLCRLADGVPAVFEEIVDWSLDARVPGPDGRPVAALTWDDQEMMWRAAPGTGDLVFETAHDSVLKVLDALVPAEDASAWAAAAGMLNHRDHPSPAALRQEVKFILGCAALEGRSFTVEVVAAVLGLDAELLIDGLDEYLVRNDETGLLEDDGFTELSPALATAPLPVPPSGSGASRYLHHYRFRWAWQWRTCAKYFLDDTGRAQLIGPLTSAIEGLVPTMHRSAFAPALRGLFQLGSELEARGAIRTDVENYWHLRADEYRSLGRLGELQSPALATLQWHVEVLDQRDDRRTPDHDRLLLQLRLTLAEAILHAVADGELDDARLAAAEAERAATLAITLGSKQSEEQARTLHQAAAMADALLRTTTSDDARESLSNLLAAGLGKAADANQLDPSALAADSRQPLAQAMVTILDHREIDLDARIAASLTLGRIGDPRFERRDGPEGAYISPPLVAIPAGSYPIGSSADPDSLWFDPKGFADEREAHEVELDAFGIGRYPVTNAEWACFMAADGYVDERWWTNPVARAWLAGDPKQQELGREGWRNWWRSAQEQVNLEAWLQSEAASRQWSAYQLRDRRGIARLEARRLEEVVHGWYPDRPPHEPSEWRNPKFNNPSQPVVGVSWFEALAYSNWLSAQTGLEFRLPSEVQWEAAARGTAGRRFAFGDVFDQALANTAETELERTTPVGAYSGGSTPEGVHDLCGNVWEWTRSLWGTNGEQPDFTYRYVADDGREKEEAPAQRLRVLRGGSWIDTELGARAAVRYGNFPTERFTSSGFRLVCASPISLATER